MSSASGRRNRLIARVAACATVGLLAGAALAIPFSGHDGRTVDGTATTAPLTSGSPTTRSPTTQSAPASSSVTSPASTVLPTDPSPTTDSTASTSPSTSPTTTAVAPDHPLPAVDAAAFTVIDASSGAVLAANNADAERPVGSIFKLLTAYVVMRAGDPTKVVTIPPLQLVEDESRIFMNTGEQFPRDLLLRAMLIVSAGDAAEALAVDVAGSVPAFVERMNDAAHDLGLTHTVAANPEGLDADGAHSSASDVAALAKVLMADDTFRATVGRRSASLHGVTFPTTNTLLAAYQGATGIKTGHTSAAGYCLAASATRDGRSLIVVVLGTSSIPARDVAAASLLDWGFAELAAAAPPVAA